METKNKEQAYIKVGDLVDWLHKRADDTAKNLELYEAGSPGWHRNDGRRLMHNLLMTALIYNIPKYYI